MSLGYDVSTETILARRLQSITCGVAVELRSQFFGSDPIWKLWTPSVDEEAPQTVLGVIRMRHLVQIEFMHVKDLFWNNHCGYQSRYARGKVTENCQCCQSTPSPGCDVDYPLSLGP